MVNLVAILNHHSAYIRRALNRTETRSFLEFIGPESTLMKAIMRLNRDPNALYEIYFNLLPVRVR